MSLYCRSAIPDIESFMPNPTSIRAIHPPIPKMVMNRRFLYLKRFLNVDFFEKLIFDQNGFILSSIILLPLVGDSGRISAAGTAVSSFTHAHNVAASMHPTAAVDAIRPYESLYGITISFAYGFII